MSPNDAAAMSSLSSSSGVAESVIVGFQSQYKFNGMREEWPNWKEKMLAYFSAAEMREVIDDPIAPTDEEVKALLEARPGQAAGAAGNDSANAVEVKEDANVSSVNDASSAANTGSQGGAAAAAAAAPSASSSSSSSSSTSDVKPVPAKKLTKKEKEAQAAAQQALVKKSRKAYSFLLCHVPAEMQTSITSSNKPGNAHAAWQRIVAKYERNTVTNRLNTRSTFQAMAMARGEKFDSYWTRIQAVVQKLRSQGASVSEEEVMHVVLKGLPQQYDLLVTAIRISADHLQLDDIIEKIRDAQDTMLNKRDEDDRYHSRAGVAHFVRGSQLPASGGGYRSAQSNRGENYSSRQPSYGSSRSNVSSSSSSAPRLCHLCSESDHLMFDCPSLPSKSLKCNKCRRVGHVEANCRSRLPGGFQRGGRGGGGGGAGARSFAQAAERGGSGTAAASSAMSLQHEREDADGDSADEWQVMSRRGRGSQARDRGRRVRYDDQAEEEQGWSSYVQRERTEVEATTHSHSTSKSSSSEALGASESISSRVRTCAYVSPPSAPWSLGPPQSLWTQAHRQSQSQPQCSFIMDSGSTETISNQREHVKHITTLEVPVRVRVANNASVSLHESGTVALQCPHGSSNTSIELHGVLINEDMPVSLLSVSQLCESGGEVHFTNSHCTVTKGGRTVATIPKLGQLYVWPVHKPTQQPKKARKKKAASAAAAAAADSAHAMAVEERKDCDRAADHPLSFSLSLVTTPLYSLSCLFVCCSSFRSRCPNTFLRECPRQLALLVCSLPCSFSHSSSPHA